MATSRIILSQGVRGKARVALPKDFGKRFLPYAGQLHGEATEDSVSRGIRSREPRTSQGGGGRGPTARLAGGAEVEARGGDDQPSYGERLRRYRLGVLLALSSVVMLFVSFTTAYVVRKAGAVWDPARNDYISNWAPLTLPIRILLVNTFILLLSSFTLEIARRRAAEDVALAPIVDMPGIRVSASHALPWVWTTIVLGLGFLAGQAYAWHRAAAGEHHASPLTPAVRSSSS